MAIPPPHSMTTKRWPSSEILYINSLKLSLRSISSSHAAWFLSAQNQMLGRANPEQRGHLKQLSSKRLLSLNFKDPGST